MHYITGWTLPITLSLFAIGWEIAFDGAGLTSFGNDFSRNVVIFGVDNSSSSHTDNCKSNILVFVEGPTDDINAGFI